MPLIAGGRILSEQHPMPGCNMPDLLSLFRKPIHLIGPLSGQCSYADSLAEQINLL